MRLWELQATSDPVSDLLRRWELDSGVIILPASRRTRHLETQSLHRQWHRTFEKRNADGGIARARSGPTGWRSRDAKRRGARGRACAALQDAVAAAMGA
jgi:hypothetical protein